MQNNDLISRKALIEAFWGLQSAALDEWSTSGVVAQIEKAPTVDAVILHCKVGDTLFFVMNGEIYSGAVRFLRWENHKDRGVSSEIRINPNPYFTVGASFDDFGKTVFLTREEAEAALTERKKKDA